jgi:hypothetical protein
MQDAVTRTLKRPMIEWEGMSILSMSRRMDWAVLMDNYIPVLRFLCDERLILIAELNLRNMLKGLRKDIAAYKRLPDWLDTEFGLRLSDDVFDWDARDDTADLCFILTLWLAKFAKCAGLRSAAAATEDDARPPMNLHRWVPRVHFVLSLSAAEIEAKKITVN